MEMDLHRTEYDPGGFQKYVYGSAEVVGLMCLKIFTDEEKNYDEFVYSARKLGEAFQKINFLRDLKDDFHERGRSYFPHVDMSQFSEEVKKELEADIQYDFDEALTGIKRLNPDARFGVYIAYYYYTRLFRKIRKVSAQDLLQHRYRIPNIKKFYLVFEAYIRYTLRIY
jgi:phytoene/squalene synthetase